MRQQPRPVGEGVLTPRMWRGIAFVEMIMAAGTLFALDISVPGSFVDGSGSLRYAQAMAFTTLRLFQIFNVINARSDDISAFVGLFTNPWLWAALALSVAVQVTVVYVPALQQAFGTVGLSAGDWLRCIAIASLVLWLREIGKLLRGGTILKFDDPTIILPGGRCFAETPSGSCRQVAFPSDCR